MLAFIQTWLKFTSKNIAYFFHLFILLFRLYITLILILLDIIIQVLLILELDNLARILFYIVILVFNQLLKIVTLNLYRFLNYFIFFLIIFIILENSIHLVMLDLNFWLNLKLYFLLISQLIFIYLQTYFLKFLLIFVLI
jgi:hypothetical protein